MWNSPDKRSFFFGVFFFIFFPLSGTVIVSIYLSLSLSLSLSRSLSLSLSTSLSLLYHEDDEGGTVSGVSRSPSSSAAEPRSLLENAGGPFQCVSSARGLHDTAAFDSS